MWPYYPELLKAPVPRYTSYPTAAEFGDVDARFHETGFDLLRPGDLLSLYVHIPFCEKICWYCGCNTGAANRPARLTSYLDALHAEIETVSSRLTGDHPISQIAFGGGSPNAITPVDFVRLLDHLLLAFNAYGARLSIELDPRSLTPEWIDTLGRTGVSLASMGVQTFDPEIQRAIGREQPLVDVQRGVTGLRAAGIRSLNFDLMYGLPGQTRESLSRTIEETIALNPDRIALFGYAHLPAILPRQRQIDGDTLSDGRARFDMAALGHEKFLAAGYQAVGFDHYARPEDPLAIAACSGKVRRNFQGFTDDCAATLIGLGASAISAFPDRFVQNEKNSGRYRLRAFTKELCGRRGIVRTSTDRENETVISSLLCSLCATIRPSSVPSSSWQMLDTLQTIGLITYESGKLTLVEKGRPYARFVASLFDRYQAEGDGTFSNAI